MIKQDPTSYGTITAKGSLNDVYVGKYCSIAENCIADCGFNHRTNVISTYPFDLKVLNQTPKQDVRGDIHIGNDVWIGADVVIMGGITIGDGAVIGIRSIVTKDIPPYAIAAGAPCTIKKYRFSEDIVFRMLQVKWWDWPQEKINKHAVLLNSNNFEELFKIAGV